MRFLRLFFALMLYTVFFANVQAQTKVDANLKEWERAKAYTKDYLQAMPEGEYGLKPTPEMRSFAEQMLHLAADNYVFASAATGDKFPEGMDKLEKTSEKTKAAVIKNVDESYDFVIASIKKLTPAQLDEKVKLFGRFEFTKEQALNKGFEHQTHHRGQTTVYIRLAKTTPPSEKLF